ncbi:ribose-phosphate pyrophosphokinase-like domain-containing protein, partial [Aurantimicrobium sp.]
MSELSVPTKKKLVIVSGRAHPQLATDVAAELKTHVSGTDLRTFANGEIYARYDD